MSQSKQQHDEPLILYLPENYSGQMPLAMVRIKPRPESTTTTRDKVLYLDGRLDRLDDEKSDSVVVSRDQSKYMLGVHGGHLITVSDRTGASGVIVPKVDKEEEAILAIEGQVEALLANASSRGMTLPAAAITKSLMLVPWMEDWFGFTIHNSGYDFLHVYCGPHTIVFSKHGNWHRATFWRDGYVIDDRRYAMDYHPISVEDTLLLAATAIAPHAARFSTRQQIWALRQKVFGALCKLHRIPRRKYYRKTKPTE